MTIKENIFLKGTKDSKSYRSVGKPIRKKLPKIENTKKHANMIQRKLENSYKRSLKQKKAAAIKYNTGVYLEFESFPEFDLITKSLEDKRKGIRLLNVREDDKTHVKKATIYIPEGKESYLFDKLKKYETELTKKNIPRNNDLFSSINDVKLAMIDAFWIGDLNDMPLENANWCEVWLRYDDKVDKVNKENFFECCRKLNIKFQENVLIFPERIVVLVKANKKNLVQLTEVCEYIAEYRRAPEASSFFEDLDIAEQNEWLEDLLKRVEIIDSNSYICILDTGLNNNHKLISNIVTGTKYLHSIKEEWGVGDHHGHGTEMAGIAIYNNLVNCLASNDKCTINHKIESVKILPPNDCNEVELYGAITKQAVYLAEIENPNVNRVICMAITAPDFNTNDGSPTSWSSAVDSITSGADDEEKRLFFISAGNVYPNELSTLGYPNTNIMHSIENPGQSWNAITVGAYSNNIQINDPTYDKFKPVADVNELSPYSATSRIWNKKWPIKPEILFDGGNIATNGNDYTECEELSLLTTSHRTDRRQFTTTWGTSPATAQAANMASALYNAYPKMWAETVRGLIIHSARWTDRMISQFCETDSKSKGRSDLLRTCGYGIPKLDRALECKENSVNLIIEDELKPFKKVGNEYKMNEMHFHKLPWPKQELIDLGETDATIRVTLSYFIEPGPGEIGWKDKYRYPSCGLRFDAMSSGETLDDFQKRVNVEMRGEDYNDNNDGESLDWYLGTKNRNVGSIHSDFFKGSAVELSNIEYLAVYPVIGWWRERAYLGKYDSKIRYSLIVTIETPSNDVELYTSIMTKINTPIEIEI